MRRRALAAVGFCQRQLAGTRVPGLKASLLNDQYRCRKGLALLNEVERPYEELEDRHEFGRVCVKRSSSLESPGRPGEASDECARVKRGAGRLKG